MTWEEFRAYYERHGRCVNDISPRTQPLNERKLRRRYEAYLKSEEKRRAMEARASSKSTLPSKPAVVDERWDVCREEVWRRDGGVCQLTFNAATAHEPLDVAHVFAKGAFPRLKYDRENLVLLCRTVHSRLDQRCDPWTGEYIGERVEEYWRGIVGEERYDRLKKKAMESKGE